MMLEEIVFFGWFLMPIFVPTIYYVVRRNSISHPIRFLLYTSTIAIFLYWMLAFPLAFFLWWLFPSDASFFSLPHLYAAQTLLTLPFFPVLIRAEREQRVSRLSETSTNIG